MFTDEDLLVYSDRRIVEWRLDIKKVLLTSQIISLSKSSSTAGTFFIHLRQDCQSSEDADSTIKGC
jgi:hypothetical protein